MADQGRGRREPWSRALRPQGAAGRCRRRPVAPCRPLAGRRGAPHRRRAGRPRALSAGSSISLLAGAEQQQLRRLGAAPRRHRVRSRLARNRTQMASLTLREATRADARAIAEIHVAAWRAAYRDLMPQSYLDSLSVEERAPMWEKTIAQPGPA